LEKLRKSPDARLAAAAEAMAKELNWPARTANALPIRPPLSAKHQAQCDLGRKEYLALCAACHHPAGYGDAGKGPACSTRSGLIMTSDSSAWCFTVWRGQFPSTMKCSTRRAHWNARRLQGAGRQKIAGIVTYIRREMRDQSPPIEPETVRGYVPPLQRERTSGPKRNC